MTAKIWDKRSGKYDDAIKQHSPDYQHTIEAMAGVAFAIPAHFLAAMKIACPA